MHDDHDEIGEPEREPARRERVRDREREDEVPAHPAEEQQSSLRRVRGDGVCHPRVAAVHPPDHGEHQHDLCGRAQPRIVVDRGGQLGDREDEDQVEEELERRDPVRLDRHAEVLATAA